MGSKRKQPEGATDVCFLHLQQDSCSAPGPEWWDSFHKGRDKGCEATKVCKMMLVLEYVTQVGEFGRVSPRGFNKEDQEIRERYPTVAGLGQSSQRLTRLLEEHYVSSKVWPDLQGLI